MNVQEIELHDGTAVQVQPVPSLMVSEIVNNDPLLAELPLPIVEIPSVAGGIEKVTAREGEEGYAEWFRENQRREKLRNRAFDDYVWYCGTVAWKLPGAEKFTSELPKDWKLPRKLIDLGRKPRKDKIGRIVDFIKSHLFVLPADQIKAQQVMYGPVEPITKPEGDAISTLFPGGEIRATD